MVEVIKRHSSADNYSREMFERTRDNQQTARSWNQLTLKGSLSGSPYANMKDTMGHSQRTPMIQLMHFWQTNSTIQKFQS